jgi:protein-tyrosine phosphatase
MRVKIYWITEQLAIMPRPRGGDWLEDEIESLKQQGITAVASLLEPEEITELDLTQEELFCGSKGLKFISFSIPDRQTPDSFEETEIFLRQLKSWLSQNEKIAIHCRQGVGRSSLIAALLIAVDEVSVDEAFAKIQTARKCAVPDTPQQKDWVKTFFASKKRVS